MNDMDLQSRELAEDAELEAAREQDTSGTWMQKAEVSLGSAIGGVTSTNKGGEPGGVAMWIAKLPKNVSVGLIDAAVNTADAVKAFAGAAADSWKAPGQVSAEGGAKASGQEKPEEAAPEPDSPVYSAAKHGVQDFRDYLAQGSETPDEITQAISQYAIPFLGWSKFIGGLQGATTAGTVARAGVTEALTAATVLAPHDPRAADILQLGKHVEGKFGDAMNTIAPDGSLLNHYINYMTDRSNESDAEGRFKNVVDNLALSAAAAGLIKTTAMTLKGGFATAKYALENAGTGPRGLAAQKGVAAFHVTPHDFSQFDMSKIGTGEGNQSFGHGLYFAESTSTAGKYVQNFWDTHGRAHVMKVDIPDAVKAKALDWDAPLSEQPDVLKKLGLDPSAVAPFAHAPYSEVTGQQLYTAMSRGQTQMGTMSKEAASKKLNEFGIPGIRYLDAGSRDAKGGTSNIVLFDSKHAEITHKDGTPVTPATKGKK